MDQVYRSFRKFATILLAMFMFVSIFDAQLIGAEGSSSSAKISHICDEQNIPEAKANEELLIPWTSTIETATSDLVNYTEYVGTMETNLWSTPNQLKLIVQEENSGTTRTLVEGTDFKILYQRADGFYEEDKTKVTTFQNFKLQFLDESKTFFKLTVHYNTYGKLSDITDQEEQREFISEGVWKIEHNNKINQSASYIYKNPGYKAVEVEEKDETIQSDSNPSKNSETEQQGTKEDKKQANNALLSSSEQKSSVGIVPPSVNANITYPDRYRVWENEKTIVEESAHQNSQEGNQYKFGDFGEKYDIFNILANYNVFTFDYYHGTHVVGPMIVGGDTVSSGLGGLSHKNSESSNRITEYIHTVPSYFKGSISATNTIITSSYVPVFIGTNESYNIKDFTLQKASDQLYKNFYFTDTNDKTNDYVDFDKAKKQFSDQIQAYQNASFTGVDAAGHQITTVTIKNSDYEEIKNVGDKKVSEDGTYYFEKTSDSGGQIGLRLKLGYNYVFENGLFSKIKYIVYDYDSYKEATTMTTFLNIPDQDKVTFPALYKSQSDALGTAAGILKDPNNHIDPAYQFSSSEVEEAFNIAYFLANTNEISVDIHLVGHVVAPNAHVDISSGDYNGAVIAKSVTSQAEAHMWPFKLNTSIAFDKTVNGKTPESGEKFTFNLKNVYKPNSAEEIADQTAMNNSSGRVFFAIDNLSVKGDYIYEISEQDPGAGYAKNNQKYYALVSLEESSSSLSGGKIIPVFKGFYKSFNLDKEEKPILSEEIGMTLTFNNKREFGVEKQWYDYDGNLTDGIGMPEINATLMQRYVEDTGKVVTYNLYSQYGDGSGKRLIETVSTKGLNKGATYSIALKCDANTTFNSVVMKEGNDSTSITHNAGKVTVSGIEEDTVVNITVNTVASNSEFPAKLDLLEDDVNNKVAFAGDPIVGETVYKTFKLSEENHWYQGFDDLDASGEIDEYPNMKFKFYYYVKEDPVTGFKTEYQNNQGTINGTIFIKNKEIPQDFILRKISSTGNNNFLKGAEFTLTNITDSKNQFDLKFTYNQNTDSYKIDEQGKDMLTTNGKTNIKIEKLPIGDYVLTETKAPGNPGDYEIDFKNILIHIDRDKSKSYYILGVDAVPENSNEKVQANSQDGALNYADTSDKLEYTFTVENTPNIVVPETGGTFDGRYQRLGFLIACGGLAMFVIYECKRSKNMKKSKN